MMENGEYNGYGKLTENNIPVYEGMWQDSEYHGYGTKYAKDGTISYKGMWRSQKKWGMGKEEIANEVG